MDRDVMERLGVSAGDALNVAVHYVMIATVVDEADTCIGYRLYDCRYNNVYNYRRYYNKYPNGDGNAKDH